MPAITVATITLKRDANRAPLFDPNAYAIKLSGNSIARLYQQGEIGGAVTIAAAARLANRLAARSIADQIAVLVQGLVCTSR